MATADRAGGGSVNFDRAAGYYDVTRGLPPEVGDRVAARIEAAARPGARFLEIGVGTGRIALPLQRRGAWVAGVDLSAAMMATYRGKAAAAGLPAPRLLRGDVGWGPGLPHRPNSPRDALQRRMRELTAAAASTPEWVGVGDARQKLAALTGLGGVEEPLGAETWATEETWAAALDEVDGRIFSYAWRVPEDVWRAAAARVRAEATADHPDLDAPVAVQRAFHLSRVRFDG